MEVTREGRSVKTLLVVDDDKVALEACKHELGEHRHVLLATSVPTAMVFLRRELDLAIFDERLGPGHLVGAGLQLISDFKEFHPDLVVVLVSAVMTKYSERLAYDLGAAAVFEKTQDTNARAWIPTAEILAFVEGNTEPPGLDERELKKLARIERDAIVDTLLQARGNISQAARVLGITRRALQRKVQSLGLGFDAPDDPEEPGGLAGDGAGG